MASFFNTHLPVGWEIATLGDVGKWTSGGTPLKNNTRYFNGPIPWVMTGDLNDGPVNNVPLSITHEGLANSSAKIFPSGTLLIAMYGATIGKLGILKTDASTNQACAALLAEGTTKAIIPYLFYFLLFQRGKLKELGQGGAQPNINQKIIKEYEFPCAPEAEQARIVSKIEELFSDLEKGEESLRQAQAQLKRYRQSVLKAAVTGELTRDWREQNKDRLETGETLLNRILKARREAWEKAELEKMKAKGVKPKDDSWKKKYDEPKGPDATGLPELPKGWVWASIAAC